MQESSFLTTLAFYLLSYNTYYEYSFTPLLTSYTFSCYEYFYWLLIGVLAFPLRIDYLPWPCLEFCETPVFSNGAVGFQECVVFPLFDVWFLVDVGFEGEDANKLEAELEELGENIDVSLRDCELFMMNCNWIKFKYFHVRK